MFRQLGVAKLWVELLKKEKGKFLIKPFQTIYNKGINITVFICSKYLNIYLDIFVFASENVKMGHFCWFFYEIVINFILQKREGS